MLRGVRRGDQLPVQVNHCRNQLTIGTERKLKNARVCRKHRNATHRERASIIIDLNRRNRPWDQLCCGLQVDLLPSVVTSNRQQQREATTDGHRSALVDQAASRFLCFNA